MTPHHHAHAHDHRAGRRDGRRRLTLVLCVVVVYMLAEVAGGVLANSLALLADAGHMLSDAGALALALFAARLAQRPATARHTYGYHRTEILAALVNGAALLAIALFIAIEAVQRLSAPAPVQGLLLSAIAAGGLVVNLVALRILHGGRHASLNLRGAWLHVLSDTLGSVGALVAGFLVAGFGWQRADPIASLVISALVILSAWNLLRETTAVLMEGAPGHIDVDRVRDAMLRVDGVRAVGDLHVWTITSGMVALSAHVEAATPEPSTAALLAELQALLRERFGIDHITLQIEPPRGRQGIAEGCQLESVDGDC